MMNLKNFRVLSPMCTAAFCAAIGLGISACSTQEKQNSSGEDVSHQVQNSTGNTVSDQTFSSDSTAQASLSPEDEDAKSPEQLGTRVRRKKSKRGVASVDSN